MPDRPSYSLEQLLRSTCEELEQIRKRLETIRQKREWTVTEEDRHKGIRKAIRYLTNEALPWARIGVAADRAAAIEHRVMQMWYNYINPEQEP